ncbi:zinc-binding dehydrogenase [Phenylobacterium sp. LjRoot225]|uniref:zinc-binding dehydrogenase n=1 Tax=Phenylobacterium sp. LjRoot225 TaxID=3342285 RepID=UPI003ED0B844
MTSDLPAHGLKLISTVTRAGELVLQLVEAPVAAPGADEVVIRVEATPINPSDLGVLLGPADLAAARFEGSAERPTVAIPLSPAAVKALAGRLDRPLSAGNEGAGQVVAAGDAARSLLGKRVAVLAGGMYAQYRTVRAADGLVLPKDVTAAEGASAFVNPLTALAMVETMKLEGHTGLVHTAAASNLGQMLVRICLEEGVPLVNIVRKPEQAELLRSLGARHVCCSSAPGFFEDLVQALGETRATLAFDAIGGGRTAGQILAAMEAVAAAKMTEYSVYGSGQPKQVYIYGALDPSPTELVRNFGLTWGVGGWLMPPVLLRIGPQAAERLRARVLAGLKTVFASRYTREISLAEMLQRETLLAISRKATGEKFLLNPSK